MKPARAIVELSLSDVVAAVQVERAELDRLHPPALYTGVCRYCGKYWRRYNGTRIDGHVACAIRPHVRELVGRWLDADPSHTFVGLNAALGVGVGVVRAWWNLYKGNPRP